MTTGAEITRLPSSVASKNPTTEIVNMSCNVQAWSETYLHPWQEYVKIQIIQCHLYLNISVAEQQAEKYVDPEFFMKL